MRVRYGADPHPCVGTGAVAPPTIGGSRWQRAESDRSVYCCRSSSQPSWWPSRPAVHPVARVPSPITQSSAGAGLEKGAIRVGMLPIVDAAYLQRAQVAGYFAAEGLAVELVTIQGGAAAVPQLVTGELDMTFTNNVSLLLAQFQKTGDFRFIDGGYQAGKDTFLVMADPSSAIRSPGTSQARGSPSTRSRTSPNSPHGRRWR